MATHDFQIAVLPGDGIGPEVIAEALKALRAAARDFQRVRLHFTEHAAGAGEYLRGGDPLPAAAFEACRSADAVLLGAMGLPSVRWSDGREMTPQIDLRERLDLYAGLRPITLYHPTDSPLKGYPAGGIDLAIVRESTEGLFSGRLSCRDPRADEVRDCLRISRHGSERLFRFAFDLARRRRRRLTLVDKANVLPSMAFFRQIFDETAARYPDVEVERIYVDAMALYLVRCPERFDVIVTENMYGDILSDLAAGIAGGMGMAPSADLGDRAAVFQPAHGTAPDIAGKGIANPIAAILSAAMLLEWLDAGETRRGAERIRAAVKSVLADPGRRTPDLGGRLTAAELGDLVAERIEHPENPACASST
jgi:3-isopropylmalate dehydrogenase